MDFHRLDDRLITDSNSSKTACIIGIIIATAAVFEIHIDTNIVTEIKPKFNLNFKFKTKSMEQHDHFEQNHIYIFLLYSYFLWLHPMIEITFKATRLCKLQNCTANATIKPPMNINIASFIYIIHVLSVSCSKKQNKKKMFAFNKSIINKQ